jgi:hypothetical protein
MNHRLTLLLGLLLAPAPCFAELTPYQKAVVGSFRTPGSEKPIVEAYEASNAGRATPVQKTIIRNSELIHEDLVLTGCVRSNMPEGLSLDDTIGKVVAAGQGPALVAATRALFPAAEFAAGVSATAPLHEQALAAAVMLATGAKLDATTKTTPEYATQALRRRLTFNYFLSFATDGKCKPAASARALVPRG